MDEALKDAIYDVLVEHADAQPEERHAFKQVWPECGEYRFMGSLGFGGKVWWMYHTVVNEREVYVTAYPEDMTDERWATIQRVNTQLNIALALWKVTHT